MNPNLEEILMSDVLDDVTDETVDAAHVRLRVEDWEKRLGGLYGTISGWLPQGWTTRHGTPVRMHEKLMRKFGIEARQLPTLQCVNENGTVATLAPHALWIIGTNGRVDLRLGKRHYLIIDFADNFETPDWQAAPADRRSDCQVISDAWLKGILP